MDILAYLVIVSAVCFLVAFVKSATKKGEEAQKFYPIMLLTIMSLVFTSILLGLGVLGITPEIEW